MYLKYLGIVFFFLALPTYADRFSNYAEAHNILDFPDINWPVRPCPVTLELFGYVKGEGIFDTRQNFTLRDGHLLYFPLEKRVDKNGQDINDRGSFDAYAIQTRVDVSGLGPSVGNFDSKFLIEADFFGRTDATVNEFELRLAFLELTTERYIFLAGQHYHPICFPFESPDTIAFNGGIPMTPFALCPQFKLTYRPHCNLEFLIASIGYVGDRPFGVAGADDKVFRDAMMPDFYAQIRFLKDDFNYFGIGFDVNRIVPRLVTNFNYKEISPITSACAQCFIRWQYSNYLLYSKLVYAPDAAIFEMIGGIAVATRNAITDIRTYAPLRTIGWHVELIHPGAYEPGIFIGVAKNLGAGKVILTQLENEISVFGIGTNIDTVFRISPRIRWYINSFIVGLEYEYTRAAYGILNNQGQVTNGIPVANNRFYLATYYLF